MKISTLKAIVFLLLTLPAFFYSCKKGVQPVNSNISNVSSDKISETDAPGLYKTSSANMKLVLQPGNNRGQDAWIEYSPDNPDYATHNSGPIDQFKILAWTDGGVVILSRTLIRFTELQRIPSSSTIISAKIFLTGLDKGSLNLPQGNSYYPGSPYNQFGPNDGIVQQITSSWDESSVTWNTMPSVSDAGKTVIQASQKQWKDRSAIDVTDIVKGFVQDPSSNYGFMLSLANETIYHSQGFYSSESSSPDKRPKLVVTYSN